MRVVVTGATGFVGRRLVPALAATGHEVTVLSRDPEAARSTLTGFTRALGWHKATAVPPQVAFEGADAVVHLAGETVVGRWSESKKRAIRESRVAGTRNLVESLRHCERRPSVLVSASAVGYYGDRGEDVLPETEGPADDFLGQVCQDWEAAAAEASELGVRVAQARIGLVLGPGGGALDAMLTPYKLGLGGKLGDGRQWWPWVHIDDTVGGLRFALETESLEGPFNLCAPTPVRQDEFARVLARLLGRPAVLRVPRFALRLGAGEFSHEVLTSRRVVPTRLEEAGYAFKFGRLVDALSDALDHARA